MLHGTNPDPYFISKWDPNPCRHEKCLKCTTRTRHGPNHYSKVGPEPGWEDTDPTAPNFFFTSLMKESMITDRPLVLTPPALCFLRLRSRATLFFLFFFTPYSRSYFSHSNFTSCKLQNTHKVPTDTDHWQVRCSPIDSGITHNVKQTRDPK